MVSWWKRRGEKHRTDKQEGELHAFDREDDPRDRGVQSPDYRTADPRDLLVDNGATRSGHKGAPPDEATAEERRSGERT